MTKIKYYRFGRRNLKSQGEQLVDDNNNNNNNNSSSINNNNNNNDNKSHSQGSSRSIG